MDNKMASLSLMPVLL